MAETSRASRQLSCANVDQIIDGETVTCDKIGSRACSGCLLVQYCGKTCQVAHWKIHKQDCKSPLMKKSWKPQWDVEKRRPAFFDFGDDSAANEWLHAAQFGRRKYLWGNVPAIDIVQSCKNEGKDFPERFNLLFAASGDIRNVVKSLAGIPTTYAGNCEVVINDREFEVVARNAILLLIALAFDPIEAADIMIHIWYSAFIPESVLHKVQERVLPLIEDVCRKIRGRPEQSLQSKSWLFGTRTLSLILSKASWDLLSAFLKVPDGLSASKAREVMDQTPFPPTMRDCFDRYLYSRSPAWRVCATKLRTDGMLLPFGQSRKDFNTPNPTFFQGTYFWPRLDFSDPLDAWSSDEFLSNPSPARNDVYGSLYFHLQDQLRHFCQRIGNLQVRFQLFELDAMDLPGILKERGVEKHYFDRIETSNIGDSTYIGPVKLLRTFAPYLKGKLQNPHATLLALFQNAVFQYTTLEVEDDNDKMGAELRLRRLGKYMPMGRRLLLACEPWNPAALKCHDALSLFQDFDKPFDKFLKGYHLDQLSLSEGIKMKEKHTLVDKWPLSLRMGATQEEFEMLLASGHNNQDMNKPELLKSNMLLPCKYFLTLDGCGRGVSCQYSHVTDSTAIAFSSKGWLGLNHKNQRPKQLLRPQAQAVIACKLLAKGLCQKGDDCPLSHEFEVSASPRIPPRNVICSFFVRGKCNKGDDCKFQHTLAKSNGHSTKQADAQAEAANTPQPILAPTINTTSTSLAVAPAVIETRDNTSAGTLTRVFSGGFAVFGDGGKVCKLSVASDFTTILITGLPQVTNHDFIEKMLSALGLQMPDMCIRMTRLGTPLSTSAYLRIEHSMVGPFLSKELESGWRDMEIYAQLKASTIPTYLFSTSDISRGVDCRKILCSWYRPARLAFLKYDNEDVAIIACNTFNNGRCRVAGKVPRCDQPIVSDRLYYKDYKFICLLRNVPLSAKKKDIAGAIDETHRPDNLTLGRKTYEASEDETRDYVKTLYSAIGPLKFWDPVRDQKSNKIKVRVRFEHDSDAREAIAQLNGKSLDILGKGKLMAQQMISAKFKVTTTVYSMVEQLIFVRAYQSTDATRRFTSLKVEGDYGDDFTNAKKDLERLLGGIVAMAGGKAVWDDCFMQPVGLSRLKQIEKDFEVLIHRDSLRSQVRLYGLPRAVERAQYTLYRMVKSGLEGYAIVLSPTNYLWILNGGFQQIVSAVGEGVIWIDILSTPKRLLIAGGPDKYHNAIVLLKTKQIATSSIEAGQDEDDCKICWCPAESPVRTKCSHSYCLQCFENLCSSATTGNKDVAIICEAGDCKVVLSLEEIQQHLPEEIQQHLPSAAFEGILEASFHSYVRKHPDAFHYCPAPDCGNIYRASLPTKFHTCAKCLTETCTSCRSAHPRQTCAEYKYQASGGDEAFEKLKSAEGYKDCPQCETIMEKTDGCNHMTCLGCKIHLCWLCLETFSEDVQCYNHINFNH
ncbi:hypothetical protein DSL72_003209 [Monilinia vaccinii-corymbosi]|uniref:Suppressor of anucleate metulae protein B n=1 Tax=Monilinia vaccinii-corymbosi TaxID=61207 RepID=A0A8A3P7N6_9HELO|nr:hypothetical protein DSL72_003209 [Monilinia vaccinii-corymbosi]